MRLAGCLTASAICSPPPKGPTLDEQAQLSMAPGEEGTGDHGGQVRLAEALGAAPRRGTPRSAEAVDGPPIAALGLVGRPR